MSTIPILCKVQALYPFKSNDPSSLSFNQDDYIDVLTKLPSGWWDGLCNDTRGWFPSNYVRVIEEHPEFEHNDDTIEVTPAIKSEYRLSLAYTNNVSTSDSNDKNHWIVERTEDGTGYYYYNPITGEMKFKNDEEEIEQQEQQLLKAIPPQQPLQQQQQQQLSIRRDIDDLEADTTTLNSSNLMMDSGSESDHRSTIDIPWSDGSTLLSIEEKPQWIHRVTSQPQVKSFFGIETIEKPARSSSRRPSVLINTVQPEALSWNKLATNISFAIHQLATAAKNGQYQLYYPCSISIVNAIRFMLISSSTIDKDSSYIKTNGTIRSHHRAMMASMSKLTLSAQTFHSSFDNADNTISKILTESSDLLLLVRNFINTCQDLNLPLNDTDPKWIDDDAQRRPSHSSQRYSLQINLAENLETMGTCIQDSAETIIKCIASYSSSNDQDTNKASSLAALLFTHFRNLSNQTGLFLGYLDETDFLSVQGELEMTDLTMGKQHLAEGLGVLFFKMQALTNEDNTNFDKCLEETEAAAGSLFEPIELICASVLKLANKNRSRSNSNASCLHSELTNKPAAMAVMDESVITEEDEEEEDNDDLFSEPATNNSTELSVAEDDTIDRKPMDRHRSEIIPNNALKSPPPMTRSQTEPPSSQTSKKLKKFFGDDAPLPETVAVKKPAATERPEFLQYDYDVNDIVFNMEGNVKGGTLPALVERLTMHDYLDMNFINTFLLTYRSFCSSMELLDLLEARYNLQCPPGLTEEEATIWEEKKLKLVRLRVFNVLKNWLELYYNEDDSVLLDRLLEFTHTHIRHTLKFSNGQLESLIQRRRDGDVGGSSGLKKMILTLPDPPEPILPRNRKRFKLLDIDTLEMARQLTIMDFKLYSAIKPIECLDKAWSQDDDAVAPNIRASIEYCNQVTSWVSDVILSQHDIKKRSVLIKYWVQVAEKCRILNNFNTCMAILSAFDNSSVGRLKRTWEVVGARTNQILQQIRKLMGANRNFTEYRAFIHSINPPCIPFLGIYLQDLTFIEDGNSNELKKNKELINFAKRAKTAEVIREIQQYQSSLYQLKPVDELQDFIKQYLMSTRDEEQLYKESLKLEPREREDEKITRLLQESGFL